MADLIETASWEAGIYQLEQNDPVLGGPPDLAQEQGFDNVPHQQLAKRTLWLKGQIEALQQTLTDVTNGAPGALDTLNELAAALGDDPNFAASTLSAIAKNKTLGLFSELSGTQNVSLSVATYLTAYDPPVKNTLVTTTFVNGLLNIGAGESGWWVISPHVGFSAAQGAYSYNAARIERNGDIESYGLSLTSANLSTGRSANVCYPTYLDVGDTIRVSSLLIGSGSARPASGYFSAVLLGDT
jgi:hypothetical protein